MQIPLDLGAHAANPLVQFRRLLDGPRRSVLFLYDGNNWYEGLLLCSRNVRTNGGRTLVPNHRLWIHYTVSEGGLWHTAIVWPDVYLRAIRTGRLGALRYCSIRLGESKWIYDSILADYGLMPWRARA